ncbi:TOG array regulator of axonemal microtubules protein 2-like [Notolabrus celidotus]|uniref:TOG array regulator of axonemal microtubules protein 2-like n=1 Tax=Notolabrus celidotus TaxID=1203425 RepID=UPI00148FFD06|nr:TOG array regulator of axonemal microtubules protein 2-like [Notolabrus celidotus]
MEKWINMFFGGKKRRLIRKDQSLENHQSYKRPGLFSRKTRILDLQETKTEALLSQTQTLCAAEEARTMAVLERLKLPSIQPTNGPKERSHRGPQRLPVIQGVKEDMAEDEEEDEEEDEGQDEGHLSRDWSYNRLDNHTPDELRGLPQITSPVDVSPLQSPVGVPPAFKRPNRGVSCIPVMKANLQGANKETATGKVEAIQNYLKKWKPEILPHAPRPPVAPRAKGVSKKCTPTPKPSPSNKVESSVTPLHPSPPPQPAPPKVARAQQQYRHPSRAIKSIKKTASLCKLPTADKIDLKELEPLSHPEEGLPLFLEVESSVTPLHPSPPPQPAPPKVARAPQQQYRNHLRAIKGIKKPASVCKPPTADEIILKELKPLSHPEEGLPIFLGLLSSNVWEEKVKGLQSVQALAQHHPDILKSKLHEVCYAVIEEVKNLRSSVASVAVDTVGYLHVYLQKDMDPLADQTGSALLRKIAQSSANAFLLKQAIKALDSLVLNCSPGPVLNVLFGTGLSHLCAAVRACTAEKLHKLAADLGAAAIMKSGKAFAQKFLIAVNNMSVDASAEVRRHGLAILGELALQPNFRPLWENVVTQKDRPLLEKILKKMQE